MNDIISFFDDRKQFGIKPGLDRMNKLFELLDHPEQKLKAIHVAGTNGKGSTINFIKQALINNGYSVGVFTSPSFSGLTGHIEHNNEPISEEQFLTIFHTIYPAIQQLDQMGNYPTEFEIITVLAFVYFANHVDIALIEAGMGGREDTTNCFQPILSIITNVDLDHTAFLGKSIKEIAFHKAGIIKQNIPVIIGEMNRDALSVINQTANQLHAQIYEINKAFRYQKDRQINNKQFFDWTFESQRSMKVEINMQGKHQIKNCSLAIMALTLLERANIRINWDLALEGLSEVSVPGRFETIQQHPIIILDGAHNPAGIQSFIETVIKTNPKKERHLLFAAFKDKDIRQMLKLLTPHFKTVTLSSFDHPRAATADQLFEIAKNEENVLVSDWQNAIINMNNNLQHVYYITGSLHFISIVRPFVMEIAKH